MLLWHDSIMKFFSIDGNSSYDRIGGTTKRDLRRATLQDTKVIKYLTTQYIFKFCSKKILRTNYIFLLTDVIIQNEFSLKRIVECWYQSDNVGYHRYVSISENQIRFYIAIHLMF